MIIVRLIRNRPAALVCAMLTLPSIGGAQETTSAEPGNLSDEVIIERLSLGEEAMSRGDFTGARDHFHRVLQLDWNNPQVYQWWCAAKDSAGLQIRQLVSIGDHRMRGGAFAEALVSYHAALRLDSTRADVKWRIRQAGRKVYAQRYLLAGLGFFLREEFESAQAQLDSALGYDPENENILALRERTRSRIEKIAGDTNLKDDPEAWEIHLAALKKYRVGEYRAAVELWERILEKYSGHPDVTANIRQAHLRLQAEGQETVDLANGSD